MIVLEPIRTPHSILCPHCGATIFNVTTEAWQSPDGNGDWLDDGDTTTETRHLTPAQKAGISYQNALYVGRRPCCNGQYIVVIACFVAGSVDDDFRDVYFRDNSGNPGPATNYLARRNKSPWCVERYESAQGPVFKHYLGPVAWDDDSWITEYGVARCTEDAGSPWPFAEKLLLDLWDDLHALTLARP